MKPRRIVLKILLALGLLLLITAFTGFFFPQQVLTVDSGPVTGDVLVVLGGTPDRPQRAAELFQAGEAPRIICSGIGDALANEAWLTNAGVPVSAISLEPQSHTTRENAKFSIALLRSLGAQRVIIVTTWYHSRRALACFEHYAPDLKFYSRPSYFGYPGQTKAEMLKPETLKGVKSAVSSPLSVVSSPPSAFNAEQRAELKMVRGYMKAEYEKMLGYWVCYGICPL
jgi:uncharacterized SAM-binding protein YcdF (DUF218 family)